MSKKSQMAAMSYLAKKKPRQYKLRTFGATFLLYIRIKGVNDFLEWREFWRVTL